MFAGNLASVTVCDKETERERTFTDVLLSGIRRDGEKTWFILAEKTEDDRARERREKQDAQVLFTAIMTDTLLEEETDA